MSDDDNVKFLRLKRLEKLQKEIEAIDFPNDGMLFERDDEKPCVACLAADSAHVPRDYLILCLLEYAEAADLSIGTITDDLCEKHGDALFLLRKQ